jgi:hypothetical protein
MRWSIKRAISLLAVFVAAFFAQSCAGGPKAAPQPRSRVESAASVGSVVIAEPASQPASVAFDPATVTEQVKSATFVDVREFIESINQIIRRQDYDAWLAHLTEDYIQYYSDPVVLLQYSEYPIIKRSGIKMKTLKDYFADVVYPSRQNDKVDDIEFVDENLIKAITVSLKGDRNILYMLEKHGDTWKIGIGRQK